jgi:beta-galactosidase
LHLEPLEGRVLLSHSPRTVISLDPSWQFLRADAAGAEGVSFDDSSWGTVDLPHTWNNLDGQDGGNNYYRGVGWYRKHYTVPAELAGQELFLKFDGASLVTDLYVNGTFVGEHQGGFAAFAWDVTPYLTAGADNVLAVKVNNAYSPNIAPLSGDFTSDGGLYRHVNLIATNPLHVSVTDYASPGVYLQQTNVSAASADLQVTTKLQNDSATPRNVTVEADVLDATGALVTTLTSTVAVDAGAGMDVMQNTTLQNPHLWNGRSDPYLYSVNVSVIDADTMTTTDAVTQPLGLRFYRVDPANGFFLNGQYLDLHGVDFHQDRINKGWAISDADQTEDVGLIRDIGATFVRLSHYQHPALTYDLLDRSGIVAWSEIPLVNGATNSQAFFDNAKQQLVVMIRQNYNHPSVCFWGMYNEIPDNTTTRNLVGQLVQLAHAEDPTRPTTAATDMGDNATINYEPDVVGFNQYFGWYYGNANDFGPWADNIHRTHPGQAIGISEYGAGASIYQHEQNPAEPANAGPWHPEEYQDLFHEAYWQQLEARPFLWAKTVWNMFDFASDGRNEGDTPGRNDKGLVTYDRQTKKDAFYWYKANWSSDPVLYITSRRFINRPTNVVEVKVYSNLDQVELTVNGVSLGTLTSTNHIFKWTNVSLAPGANAIEVSGMQGGNPYSDAVTWYAPQDLGGTPFARINFQPTGVAAPAGYDPDYGNVFGARADGLSYGWDVDNTANTRVRTMNPDPRYDTLIHMQKPGGGRVWEVAVPNGTYDVHVVAGDPGFVDSIFEINVEGVLAVSGGVNSANHFQEAWRRVTVQDGLLTVSNAVGSQNNKINFIDINSIGGGDSPDLPAAALPGFPGDSEAGEASGGVAVPARESTEVLTPYGLSLLPGWQGGQAPDRSRTTEKRLGPLVSAPPPGPPYDTPFNQPTGLPGSRQRPAGIDRPRGFKRRPLPAPAVDGQTPDGLPEDSAGTGMNEDRN